jgi:hypothetical protein
MVHAESRPSTIGPITLEVKQTEASGRLTIGDKKEIDKATWRKPRGIRLTSTSRYIRDKLFPT